MKIGKIFYTVSVSVVYLAITLFWFICYVFLGEDVELSSVEDFLIYGKITTVYLSVVLLHLLLSKRQIVNVVMCVVGLFLLPLLIAGYKGAVNGIISMDLMNARMFTLIIHVMVYGAGCVKLYLMHRSVTGVKA